METPDVERNVDVTIAYGDYPSIWSAPQVALINLGHGVWNMADFLRNARSFTEYYEYAVRSNLSSDGDFPRPEEVYEEDEIRLHDDIARLWNEEVPMFQQLWKEWIVRKSEPEAANILIYLIGSSYRMLLECSMRGEQLTRLKQEMYYSKEEQEQLVDKFIAALMQEAAQSYVRTSLQRTYKKETTESLLKEYAEPSKE